MNARDMCNIYICITYISFILLNCLLLPYVIIAKHGIKMMLSVVMMMMVVVVVVMMMMMMVLSMRIGS